MMNWFKGEFQMQQANKKMKTQLHFYWMCASLWTRAICSTVSSLQLTELSKG